MLKIIKGIATPLLIDNIDTEVIIPATEIVNTFPDGSDEGLFAGWRYTHDKSPNPDFILNNPIFAKTEILIVGDNFGCGSSREQAVWALMNFGIKCIIGASYSDIFCTNSIKNGLILIALSKQQVTKLDAAISEDKRNRFVSIDFIASTVHSPAFSAHFTLDPRFKKCLLGKVDEIEHTLEFINKIREYETNAQLSFPWLNPKLKP